jgi:hypothetical protein
MDTRARRIPLNVTNMATSPITEEAVLIIRPEAIDLATAAPTGPGVNLLEGKIRTHMFVGQWVRYWIDVPMPDATAPRELIVDVPDPRERGILDGQIFLRLDPRKLHLLETETVTSQPSA